ncbi:MAG: hypothetical protein COV45_07820 [Deltaproteobacteria bacterium CG11_big_fil_rev_8_21_14_0_20_47_16]|nr:MAG: hypothetical protein COV45_07820 [Deltaproteobacteria bacterium CG11_big_fil_rev_8_21_14_0_20_47_16]
MTTKKAAIIQCNMATTALASIRAAKQHKLHTIRLHWGQTRTDDVMDGAADLNLNISSSQEGQLRTCVKNLSQHYDIIGVLPPSGHDYRTLTIALQVAQIAEEHHLPAFSSTALKVCSNRYLTRCALQHAQIPVSNFMLIQYPSALQLAAESIGFPAQLSPIHHELPTLSVNIMSHEELMPAHHHMTHILQNWILTHDYYNDTQAMDPRTKQHLRFSISGDMIYTKCHSEPAVKITVLLSDGKICILAVATITPRGKHTHKRLTKKQLLQAEGLAGAACNALKIQNGIVNCCVQFDKNGVYVTDIIPNEVDRRLAPHIKRTLGLSLDELWLRLYSRSLS